MSTTTRSVTAKPITGFLQSINRGRLLDDAATKLRALVEDVVEVGAKGTLTIKIDVTPTKEEGRVDVIAVVSTTPPKPKNAAMFFVTDDYELSRDDPRYAEPLVSADFPN